MLIKHYEKAKTAALNYSIISDHQLLGSKLHINLELSKRDHSSQDDPNSSME